jgi:peptide chain release factor
MALHQAAMMWVFFTTGRGPGECQIACGHLPAIFIDDAAKRGITATLIDAQEGPHGLLSALVAVDGDAEEFIKDWEGTVQWTCPSPIRKDWGRKNWFVSVSVIRPPEPAEQLRDSDLAFESYRASGPGGQHVQKTDSAVRVTHKPTGLVAQAQEERSQHRNKALAVGRLSAMLKNRAEAAEHAAEHEKWTKHDALERGNPVRVYQGEKFKLK